MMIRLSQEENEQRLKLYEQGYTDAEIAGKLYLSIRAVCAWRHKNGLPRNRQWNIGYKFRRDKGGKR